MWERDESVGGEGFFVGALVDEDVDQRCGHPPVGRRNDRLGEDRPESVVAALGVGAREQRRRSVRSMESSAFGDVGVELSLDLCVEDGDHLGGGHCVAPAGSQMQGAVEVDNGGGGFLGKPYEPNAVIKNDIEFILMSFCFLVLNTD